MPILNPSDFRFGHNTQPENSFSGRNFGLWQLHQSTRILRKTPLSLNFRSKMIFLKYALILTSLKVQAHLGPPDYVT